MIVTQTPPPANRKHDRTGNFVKRARLTGEFAKIINDGLYYYEQVMVMLGKGCTGEACRYTGGTKFVTGVIIIHRTLKMTLNMAKERSGFPDPDLSI